MNLDWTLLAKLLCNADGQRHMRLQNRDGYPCRLHEREGLKLSKLLSELDCDCPSMECCRGSRLKF